MGNNVNGYRNVCLNINCKYHSHASHLMQARWTNKYFHFAVNIK